MAYILSGTTLRNPYTIKETNSTQVAVQRALSGAVGRDYMGSNKRVWSLEYVNLKASQYSVIKAIYDTYLSTGTIVTWQITENNYSVSLTNVHMTLDDRDFSVRGSDYLSDITLQLVEA